MRRFELVSNSSANALVYNLFCALSQSSKTVRSEFESNRVRCALLFIPCLLGLLNARDLNSQNLTTQASCAARYVKLRGVSGLRARTRFRFFPCTEHLAKIVLALLPMLWFNAHVRILFIRQSNSRKSQNTHRKTLLLRKIICAIKHGISNNARTILAKCSVPAFFS